MAPKHPGVLWLIVALTGTVPSSPAFGQQPLPVFVEFDFGQVKRLKNHPKSAEMELAIAERAVESFKKAAYQEFFPWIFRAGKALDFPKLKLILVEDQRMTKWELHIETFKENGTAPDENCRLSRIVSEPGQLELVRRTPRRGEFPSVVSEWLESHFLRPDSGRELHRLVKAVAPLGDCRVLSKPEIPRNLDQAEGVLLLDWDKFRYLSKSEFLVVCQEKDKALVELVSVGERKPCEYELKFVQPRRKGLGIAVKHTKWNDAEIGLDCLPKFVELSSGRVYIKKYLTFFGLPTSALQATDQ